MTLEQTKRLATHIFRLLKVTEITFPIARTNKGNLGLKFSSSHDDYEIMLDAVPLSVKSIIEDDNNIELKRMLEKYWFEEIKTLPYSGPGKYATSAPKTPMQEGIEVLDVAIKEIKEKIKIEKKHKGRPKGSKNKPKDITSKEEVVG